MEDMNAECSPEAPSVSKYEWKHKWAFTQHLSIVFGSVQVQVWVFFYSIDILLDSGESRLHLLLYIRVLTQRSHPRRRREAGHLRQREGEAGDFGKRNAR